MKKNRNAFFSENSMSYQGYNPMMATGPYQTANVNNSFYSGNIPNYPIGMDELSERLAKIERQINRLDHRLNKLENSLVKSTDDYDSTTNNMYIL